MIQCFDGFVNITLRKKTILVHINSYLVNHRLVRAQRSQNKSVSQGGGTRASIEATPARFLPPLVQSQRDAARERWSPVVRSSQERAQNFMKILIFPSGGFQFFLVRCIHHRRRR